MQLGVARAPRRAPANLTAADMFARTCEQVGVVVTLSQREPAAPGLAGVVLSDPEVALAGNETSHKGASELHGEQMFPSGPVGTGPASKPTIIISRFP